MPRPGAASMVRRTAAAPARCPAARGRPRRLAQRPLPSIIMAAWIISWSRLTVSLPASFFHCLNEGFHVVQVLLQRLAAGVGQRVLGLGHAAFKALGATDVPGLLQFA